MPLRSRPTTCWKLGGLPAGIGTTANGIYAWARKKITIRNGTIRGFYQGILLDDSLPYITSQGHLIEDIRADRNTFMGMVILGHYSIVRRNRVVETGGTVNGSSVVAGIQLGGPEGRVLNNDISGTMPASNSNNRFGLRLFAASGTVVEGNRINGTSSSREISYARGISIDNSNEVLVVGNRITSMYYGIYYDRGTSGKYMDNLTSNVTIPFIGGTPVGTNN